MGATRKPAAKAPPKKSDTKPAKASAAPPKPGRAEVAPISREDRPVEEQPTEGLRQGGTTTLDDLRARAAELREIARSARRLDDVRGMLLAIAARLERLASEEEAKAPTPPAGSAP